MKKTNMKNSKGITLVALIITIVVLLILAVVAIGAVKDSNIIAHAQNAATSYNQAKANEIDALAKYENTIEEYVPTSLDIEYYISYYFSNFSYIDKIDWTNMLIYSYNIENGVYGKEIEEPISFRKESPISEEVEIKIDNSETPVILPEGTIPLYINEMLAGYFNNNDKAYILNFSTMNSYRVTELVTNTSQIAEIEAGIASIK